MKQSNAITHNGVTSLLCDAERQPCEIWTRVMGYHRPVSSFNIGKQGEYKERLFFKECAISKKCL